MKAELRFEALSVVDADSLESLADAILSTGVPVVVVSGPESVSAPLRVPVPGCADTTTVLGHVGLTRCTVELDGIRGDGSRAGYAPAGAVAAAVCDAECERGGAYAEQVEDLCRSALHAQARQAAARADLVAATRLEQS